MFTPTLDDVENYQVDHLHDGMSYWRASRTSWTDHHQATLADFRGLGWEGQGADAALTRVGRDEHTACGAANTVQNAEATVWEGAGDLMALKSEAMAAIDAAREAGFVVNQDFSLTDKAAVPAEEAPARQGQAEKLSGNIVATVEALWDHDATVAARLDAHGAQLQAMRFADGKPLNGSPLAPPLPAPLAPPPPPRDDGQRPNAGISNSFPVTEARGDSPRGTPTIQQAGFGKGGAPAAPAPPPSPAAASPSLQGVPKPLQDFTHYTIRGISVPLPPPNVTADQLRLQIMQQNINFGQFYDWYNANLPKAPNFASFLAALGTTAASTGGVAATIPGLPETLPFTVLAGSGVLGSLYRLYQTMAPGPMPDMSQAPGGPGYPMPAF